MGVSPPPDLWLFFFLVTTVVQNVTGRTTLSSRLHGAWKCPSPQRHGAEWHPTAIRQMLVEWMNFVLRVTFSQSLARRGYHVDILNTNAFGLKGTHVYSPGKQYTATPTPQLNPRAIHLPMLPGHCFDLACVKCIHGAKHVWA